MVPCWPYCLAPLWFECWLLDFCVCAWNPLGEKMCQNLCSDARSPITTNMMCSVFPDVASINNKKVFFTIYWQIFYHDNAGKGPFLEGIFVSKNSQNLYHRAPKCLDYDRWFQPTHWNHWPITHQGSLNQITTLAGVVCLMKKELLRGALELGNNMTSSFCTQQSLRCMSK
jgi:hypothetical protein